MPANEVAVEQVTPCGSPLLEQPDDQRIRDRRLARSGEAGEEQDEPLPVRSGLVLVDHVGDRGGEVVVLAGLGQPDDRVGTGVVRQDPDAQLVVGLGVVVRRERHGQHGRVVEELGGAQRGPDKHHGRQVGCRCRPARRGRPGRAPAARPTWPVVRASVTGTNVRPASWSRAGRGREVEMAERAELRVRQRLDHAPRDRHPRQRQALRVDQLDVPGLAGRRLTAGGRARVIGLPGSSYRSVRVQCAR